MLISKKVKIYSYGGYKVNDQKLLKHIESNSEVMLGKPVIKGTRLTVEIVVEKIAYGCSFDDILKEYPFVTKQDIQACLLYAAKALSREQIYAA